MPGNSQYLEWEFEKLKKASEKFVSAETNAVTGGIDISVSGRSVMDYLDRYGIPKNLYPINKEMSSAPTVTTSTVASQITSPRIIPMGGNGDNSFPYHDANVNPLAFGAVGYAGNAGDAGCVTTNSAGTTFQNQSFRYCIDFDGTEIEFQNQSAGGMYWIKINDEYVSSAGVTLAADAAVRYIKVAFAQRTQCRIEFVSYFLQLSAIRVDATAGIQPAEVRGPRCIVVGDSFNGTPFSYPRIIADAFCWDDVWNSGMGGTGFVASNSIKTFGERLQHDVIQYAPKVAWFVGSVNDDGYDPQTVADAVLAVRNAFHAALPDSLFVWSPNAAGGAAKWTVGKNRIRKLVKAALAGLPNTIVADVLEQPIFSPTTIPSGTLKTAVTVGATSLLVYGTQPIGGYPAPGSLIQIDDEIIEVKSGSFGGSDGRYAFTLTIDGAIKQAHSAGATWTVVGGAYINGSGRVGATTGYGSADVYVGADGLHPSNAGQTAFGKALALALSVAVSNQRA